MLGVLLKVPRRNFDGVAVCKLHPVELRANAAAAVAARMKALCPPHRSGASHGILGITMLPESLPIVHVR